MLRPLLAVVLSAPTLVVSGCLLPVMGDGAREPDSKTRASATPTAKAKGARAVGKSAQQPNVQAQRRASPAAQDCYGSLLAAGVAFERVAVEGADGVSEPARLLGPIGGVDVVTRDKEPQHAILDCRLALALLSWSETLRREGITRIEHYSMYRPGSRVRGDKKISGHARGLAIDAARFHTTDGVVLDVLKDWEDRDKNADPCLARPDEAWPSRTLRELVCDAVKRNLFQVVITPHKDRAHDNHIHLERKPEVSWSYVR